MKPYVYVFVRKDISVAQQLVQVGHAAREAALAFNGPTDEIASIVMLEVANREELQNAAARLNRYGIEHTIFFEPDFEMGHSALATRPVTDKQERHVFRKYPLYRVTEAVHG